MPMINVYSQNPDHDQSLEDLTPGLKEYAAAYGDRVERQDEICLNVKKFVLEQIPNLADTNVWLNLNELGHSWED